MRVTIKSATPDVKTGVSEKNGQPWEMREQTAYIHTGYDYPERFVITLGKKQAPWPVGEYTIKRLVQVGDFGRLEVPGRLELVPVTASKAA